MYGSDPAQPIPRKNQNKPPVDLVPPALMLGAARALGHGAGKYRASDPFNFLRAYTFRTVYASLTRHLLAWYQGQEQDEESGLSHLDHVAANLSMLLHYEAANISKDDRPYNICEDE